MRYNNIFTNIIFTQQPAEHFIPQTFPKRTGSSNRQPEGRLTQPKSAFDLSGGSSYEDCRSMLFAELIRESGGWKFNAIGTPSPSDSFVEWLKQYA